MLGVEMGYKAGKKEGQNLPKERLDILFVICSLCNCHRVLQGAPPRGRQLYFTFPGAPDPLFEASKARFLTIRVATPSGAPRQAPLEIVGNCFEISGENSALEAWICADVC